MKIEYDKWGTKNIIYDNWGKFFKAFKNWHTKNKGVNAIATILGFFHKVGVPVNELSMLVLNLHGLKYGDNDLIKQEKKASRVLREIWVTGEMKNTYGLDLSWSRTSQSQPNYYIPLIGNNQTSLLIIITSLLLISLVVIYLFLRN